MKGGVTSSISRVGAIAWREFKHTALTKAFILGALGVPLFMVGVVALLPMLVKQEMIPLRGTIAVIAPTAELPGLIEAELSGNRLEERLRDVIGGNGSSRAPSGESRAGEAAGADGETAPATPDLPRATGAAGMIDAFTGVVDVAIESIDPSLDPTGEWADLKERVLLPENDADRLLAVAVIPPGAIEPDSGGADGDSRRLQIFIPPGFPPNHTILLRGAVAEATARARAAEAGIDFDVARALVQAPATSVRRLDPTGGDKAEQLAAKLMIPAAFMFLLWMSVFVSANHLLTTTIEEKSSKVIEVLLSAVSPMQLMAGKLLGQGLVSAVMLLAYGGVGLAGLAAVATLDLVPWSHLAYLVIYFVMAYFMVASIMAGVGSAANDLHEAQSLIAPAMILLMVPLMLWFPISQNPNGALALTSSFIPPLIPFVMILRVTTSNEPIAAWQIALSIVWGFTAMVAMIWLAARVFRIGVLMQGKTPTPRELFRWMLTA